MPKKKAVGKQPKLKVPHIALHLAPDPEGLYTQCSAQLTQVLAQPTVFVTPNPPAAVLTPALANLWSAIQADQGGGPVAHSALVAAAVKVRQLFTQFGKYAEGVVLAAPVEEASAIIRSVNMYESNVGKRAPKQELAIKHVTGVSGAVLCIAAAIAGALTYTFESSLDQVTWSTGIQTGKVRGTITGLTPGKVYYFRFLAFKKDGTTYQSQVVYLMVL
jgi:hypothetical protein